MDQITVTFEVPRFRKLDVKGGTVDIDRASLPPSALAYLLGYGESQSLRDVYAGEKDEPTCVKWSQERYTELVAGTIPKGGGGRRGGFLSTPFGKALKAIASATGATIDWKAVGAAGEDGLRKLVATPIAVRSKGRKANAAAIDATLKNLRDRAEAKVARDAEDAAGLTPEDDA